LWKVLQQKWHQFHHSCKSVLVSSEVCSLFNWQNYFLFVLTCFSHTFLCFVKPGHPHVLSSAAPFCTLRVFYLLVRSGQKTFSHVAL
jgi:hypothetical protein